MTTTTRFPAWLRACAGLTFAILAALSCAGPASAKTYRDLNVFFHNVTIGSQDVVEGNLNVFFGDATIAGTVRGDVNAYGGNVYTQQGASIGGATNVVNDDQLRSIAPWLPSVGMNQLFETDKRMMFKLAGSIVVIFMFLLFPMRVRIALERVEKHPGISAATGTLAMVAVIPVALMLILSIIGIPLILIEVAAIFAGVWIGQGAVALLVGRRLYELVRPQHTASPLVALLLGLALISAAEIVPIVGWAVTALVWIVALGAAILAFVHTPLMQSYRTQAPIGGPPMKAS